MRILFALLAFAIGGCSVRPPVPVPSLPLPAPQLIDRVIMVAYPTTGWLPAYDEFIRASVTPAMLRTPATRMKKFCPEWNQLDEFARRRFFSDLFFSIAKPESNYKRASIYWEEGQGSDPVTGLRIKTSEGFLQLSYSDAKSYGARCNFDYAHDRPFHLDDIASKPASHAWLGRHPNEKNIQDPLKNLDCGIAIVDHLLSSPSRQSDEFADLLGRYWSTMRRSHQEAYASIWNQMRSRNSPCH